MEAITRLAFERVWPPGAIKDGYRDGDPRLSAFWQGQEGPHTVPSMAPQPTCHDASGELPTAAARTIHLANEIATTHLRLSHEPSVHVS